MIGVKIISETEGGGGPTNDSAARVSLTHSAHRGGKNEDEDI